VAAPPPLPTRARLPARARLAVGAGRALAAASRATHLGSGSVIGGRLSLALDPDLLAELTTGRQVALVSATNGKTTTTRLLTAAVGADRPVVSNRLGANMPPGHVAALGPAPADATAVLEVDERWLGRVMEATRPTTVLLLNLSRDQLDRSHEVRKIAERWREALAAAPPRRVVANADDPIVAWAAMAAPAVVWVATGTRWRADASGCPQCSSRLRYAEAEPGEHARAAESGEHARAAESGEHARAAESGEHARAAESGEHGEPDAATWSCDACGLARPEPDWWIDGDDAVGPDGTRHHLTLALPGQVNRANATMALAAAVSMGADPARAVPALATITDVAGRYRVAPFAGSRVRLLLAKNPAGWQEAMDMLAPAPAPVVVAINARVADGHDPSWLWDVPFEALAGRLVVATGERRHDLAVRLRYAEVDHEVSETLSASVRAAAAQADDPSAVVDVAANYTAFQDYLAEVGGAPGGGTGG
jgi:lipid II isoglutaminyl synthase (glutamine-hydrolysing)